MPSSSLPTQSVYYYSGELETLTACTGKLHTNWVTQRCNINDSDGHCHDTNSGGSNLQLARSPIQVRLLPGKTFLNWKRSARKPVLRYGGYNRPIKIRPQVRQGLFRACPQPSYKNNCSIKI